MRFSLDLPRDGAWGENNDSKNIFSQFSTRTPLTSQALLYLTPQLKISTNNLTGKFLSQS